MTNKTITIFGSSLPIPGEQEYEDAYKISKKLAALGFNICSGGSMGIMDAVSKAAVEEGREAIGVTVKIFNTPATKYLTKEIKCDTLFQRLDNLVNLGDGFIVLPGGTGTLVELSLIWELFNKNVLEEKPTAAFGSLWNDIVSTLDKRVAYEKRKVNLIKLFNSIDDLVEYFNAELIKNR